jgi:hypothetical protein
MAVVENGRGSQPDPQPDDPYDSAFQELLPSQIKAAAIAVGKDLEYALRRERATGSPRARSAYVTEADGYRRALRRFGQGEIIEVALKRARRSSESPLEQAK